ncbi:MAG: hypothetical protein J6Q17_08385, partial [Clostridia bacterium]|nr:hypothetical protein [Clostridia bacterium]
FYSDSDVIILDEPTASLDAIAEQDIYNQFDRLRKDKTCIFVSHRLSSATVANKIIVLENGALIETGNHAELMKKRGVYYELFTTQAKRYITRIDGVSAEEFMTEDENISRFLNEKEGKDGKTSDALPGGGEGERSLPDPSRSGENQADRAHGPDFAFSGDRAGDGSRRHPPRPEGGRPPRGGQS